MKKRFAIALRFRRKYGIGWLTAWKSAGWEIFYDKLDKESN